MLFFQPELTMKSLIQYHVIYAVYMDYVIINVERGFTFGRRRVSKQFTSLHKQNMTSLVCALTIIGGNAGVTVDQEMKDVIDAVKDIPVTDNMDFRYKAFILINWYRNNFLHFAESFFNEYIN